MLNHKSLLEQREAVRKYAASLGFVNLAVIIPEDLEISPYDFLADYIGSDADFVTNRNSFIKYIRSVFDDVGLGISIRGFLKQLVGMYAGVGIGALCAENLERNIEITNISEDKGDFSDYIMGVVVADSAEDSGAYDEGRLSKTLTSDESDEESIEGVSNNNADTLTTANNANINNAYASDTATEGSIMMQAIRNSNVAVKEIELSIPKYIDDIETVIQESVANKEYLESMAAVQKILEDYIVRAQVCGESRAILGEEEDGTTSSSILPYMLPEDMEPITGPFSFSILSDLLSIDATSIGMFLLSGMVMPEVYGC